MASDKQRFIHMFNTKMDDFIRDLRQLVEINPAIATEVATLSTSVCMAKNFNPSSPCEMFFRLVTVPYGEHILVGNDAFFLEKTYEADGVSNNNMVDSLKRLWESMTDHDKDAVKAHMKLLVTICKKVYA